MEKILGSEKQGTQMINLKDKELLEESYKTKEFDITQKLEYQILDQLGPEKLAEINQLTSAFREGLLRMLLLNPSARDNITQTLSELDRTIYDLSQSGDPAIVLGFDETLQSTTSDLRGYAERYTQSKEDTQALK